MEVATGQLNNKQQNILSFYIMLSIEMIHIKFATFHYKKHFIFSEICQM